MWGRNVAGKWIYDNWNEYVGRVLVDDNPYVDVWAHPPKITLMEDIPGKYRGVDLWGGWQHASFVVDPGPNANAYISCTPIPKFTPLVKIDNKGNLEVAGSQVFNRFTGYLQNSWNSIKESFSDVADDVRHLIRNNDRNPRKHQPVFNSSKEEWVEKLMWEMGMKRSNYNPTFKDKFPYVNVGTVGHIDFGRANFIQFTGRRNYEAALTLKDFL